MYRYTVDNAVTYTPEDFVLFRESPFACWMERLTLENPDHGIPADIGSLPPGDSIERQDDMADTLRAEGKDVRLIDWDADESARRTATLDAMRRGVDFIVNGQLALGPLSSAANLLVRTSGYSELGDFLYIPCETQARSTLHSAFRLCFLADLLHSLQGQLPPQMLIIRGGDDLQPLKTESHIYHYRAVKQRFMESMRTFRKHRMPDPAESSHFGRWSDCAHEVLKQRLLREEHPTEEIADDDYVEPLRKAVGSLVGGETSGYDPDDARQRELAASDAAASTLAPTTIDSGTGPKDGPPPGAMTLAEQARMLQPGAYKPGPGVYRLGRPRPAPPARPASPGRRGGDEVTVTREPGLRAAPVAGLSPRPETAQPTQPGPLAIPGDAGAYSPQGPAERPRYNRRASDAALQNLEFIGSATQPAAEPYGMTSLAPLQGDGPGFLSEGASRPASLAPGPSLRSPRLRPPLQRGIGAEAAPGPVLGGSAVWNSPLLGSGEMEASPASPDAGQPAEPAQRQRSSIDLDSAVPGAYPPPGLSTSDAELPTYFPFETELVEHAFGQASTDNRASPTARRMGDRIEDSGPEAESEPAFSNSLMTSGDFDD